MRKATQHVIPKSGNWGVQRADSPRASRVFPTKKEAIEYGRNIAINQKTELIVHGETGAIKSVDCYSKKSCGKYNGK